MNDTIRRTLIAAALLASPLACGDADDVGHSHGDEQEVFTTLIMTLVPQGGGDTVTATFRDEDGNGGEAPSIDDPTLVADTTYDVTVDLLNETADPSSEEYNIAGEVREEAEEHQLFYTGDAISSDLLTWMYGDVESDYTENTGGDLPLGLAGTITTGEPGAGTLQVTLKHQPPVNGIAVKTPTSTIDDGETDIEIDFTVTVQ